MRIKNKTELRKGIKSRIGNMGMFAMLEFYEAGNWAIMPVGIWNAEHVVRRSIPSLCIYASLNSCAIQGDAAITNNFLDIEIKLTKGKGGNYEISN